jgi:3-dehydro-L-gulonate 2-dehydrogenase
MLRIPATKMEETIRQAFIKAGMSETKAAICAQIHMESSLDGVYSHGLNRVERFVDYLHKGWVDAQADPIKVEAFGVMEVWDGQMGPGITNALVAMDRATELATSNGIGLVALRNTTHWMRGGTYGRRAAEKRYVALCWTNTESCMPTWGAVSSGIGNNPLVLAVPGDPYPVVLDMAMSQYSYGRLQVTRLKGEKLPYPGGFDENGELTDDPAAIEATRRILPTGYWKGSGMAILLDLIAAILSGGKTTSAIDRYGNGSCGSCCQIFIAIDPLRFNSREGVQQAIEETIRQLKESEPVEQGVSILYPGERTIQTREENLQKGIPVDENIWKTVCNLADGTQN